MNALNVRTHPVNGWLNFADLLPPELQRRKLTRKEYAAGTLQDPLGCQSHRPASRATQAHSATPRMCIWRLN
jgi:hypothetical protein